MWPEPLDAAEQTVMAEAQIEAAYDAALRDWAPHALAAVVPEGQYGIEFEPIPDAILSAQLRWEEALALHVLPEVRALWERGAVETVEAFGGRVDMLDPLVPARDDYLDTYRQLAARVPATIRDEIVALVAEQRAMTASLVGDLRSSVTKALSGGSELFSRTRRRLGFHGASVLNHATMSTARHATGDKTPSKKQWMSILDDHTRDTHWAADGQVAPLDGMFLVGGVEMAYPGDPRGPAREVINCRCRIGILRAGEKGRHRKKKPITASGEETDMTQPVGPDGAAEVYRTFNDAVIAFIGTPTSDYRLLAKDVELSFRSMPLALTWQRTTGEGHSNAATVGVIEDMRLEDDKVLASGYLLNSPDADEAAAQLAHGVTRPSITMGSDKWHMTSEDGSEFTDEMWFNLPMTDQRSGRPYQTWTAAEIIGATLVATPAFGDTYVKLDSELVARDPALVAALVEVAPRVWPAAHFSNPQLSEPTLPTLTDDGRVYGHIACWASGHRSLQGRPVPHSPSNYTHFHTSPAVRLDDDTRLPVGRLTVGTGHADGDLNGVPAQAHYDNTGTCWALVRLYEDEHGIAFSGVPSPWATPEQIEQGLSAPLSGDWRDFGEGLDLVAALSVNTPGFAIRGRDDEYGRPAMLVAAFGPAPDPARNQLTRTDIMEAVSTAMATQIAAQRFEQERDAALAAAAELAPPVKPEDEVARILAKAGL